MKITVEFKDSISIQESLDLDELSSSLNINNTTIQKILAPSKKGEKSIDPILALEILANGFTALGTIANIISAWGDSKGYSITIKNNWFNYTITGLSATEFESIIKKLKKHEEQQEINEARYEIRKN